MILGVVVFLIYRRVGAARDDGQRGDGAVGRGPHPLAPSP